MLTADLVRARRRGGKLYLSKLEEKAWQSAIKLAHQYLQIAQACVGLTRETFEESCASIPFDGGNRRLAAGLLKLVKDQCEFEPDGEIDPRALRREVFVRAKIARQLAAHQTFKREAVLQEVATAQNMSTEELDRLLYADLRSAHRLLSFKKISAEQLVAEYELAQVQAVLLRAVRVIARVECRSPATFRYLFRKLKFLRLLFTVEKIEEGVYQLVIDGPYSLFRAVTKYGLQLALALPALCTCDSWTIQAEVLWGKVRMPLIFERKGASLLEQDPNEEPASLQNSLHSEEVKKLIIRFESRSSPWHVSTCTEVLVLPGVGLCVPDLVFQHQKLGILIYLEVLGYWNREAVWRRVDLVRAGLPYRILFAVSNQLRVSEKVLDDDLPGGIYVFKGVMNPDAIEAKLNHLAQLP